MGKRRKKRPGTAPIVDRLPLRPPFTKDQWGKMHLSDAAKNPAFLDYYQQCLTAVIQSDRVKVYLSRLAGIMHAGRLPEFAPRSFDKFLEEAEQQPLSVPRLEAALDTILEGLATRQFVLNPVEQFEFLGFLADFANSVADHYGTTDRLQVLTQHAMATALGSFIVAVNTELGCLP